MNIEAKDRLRRGILIIIVDWVCFIGWGWYNCGAVCFGIFAEFADLYIYHEGHGAA